MQFEWLSKFTVVFNKYPNLLEIVDASKIRKKLYISVYQNKQEKLMVKRMYFKICQ